MKKLILVFVTALLIFACKEETKKIEKNEAPVISKVEANPELVVVVNFKSNKADAFKLMLNSIVVDAFQKKNVEVLEKVSASSKMDVITAKFGENNISNKFQISLGNKEVKEVEIETMKFSYGKNSILIKASELAEYFIFNKYVSLEENTFKVKTKKVNGKHAPMLILRAKKMNKLLVAPKK